MVAVTEIKTMKSLNRSDLIRTNEIPYFEIPEISHLDWVRHAFLTRMGGTSPPPFESLNLGKDGGDSEDHVSRNKSLTASSFGFDPHQLILLHQVHQDRILVLREPDDHLPAGLEYDAVITHSPNRFLGIKTADCLPILIIDKAKKVVAGVHAGRQGTACQITRGPPGSGSGRPRISGIPYTVPERFERRLPPPEAQGTRRKLAEAAPSL